MFFSEIVAVYTGNHNTLYGLPAELLIVKAGGTYEGRW
jgi:hypothetical protein